MEKALNMWTEAIQLRVVDIKVRRLSSLQADRCNEKFISSRKEDLKPFFFSAILLFHRDSSLQSIMQLFAAFGLRILYILVMETRHKSFSKMPECAELKKG